MASAADLVACMEPVALAIWGKPTDRSKAELRFGNKGSVSVDLTKGTWYDHEHGEGGGVLDALKKHIQGVHDDNDAFAWLEQQHLYDNGHDNSNGASHHAKKPPLGELIATYPYTDENGNVLFEVQRFLERASGRRDFRQRHQTATGWVNNIKGVRRVPYRLPHLIEARRNNQIILIVEGEKDVENCYDMLGPATCNPMGAGKWPKMADDLNPHFQGVDVVIIGDNDEVGASHTIDVASALRPIAKSVRVLDLKTFWPDCPPKGDISDWIEAGGDSESFWAHVNELPVWQSAKLSALPIVYPFPIDEKTIPVRNWKVPGFLMAEHLTVLVAPPGAGKSLLTLQLGMACAQGIPWGGWRPRGKFRVMLINSEDDIDEMKRRLAAAKRHMKVDEMDIRNNLCIVDNSANGAVVAKFDHKSKTLVRTPLLEEIVSLIIEHKIDVVFVDPFAETFEGDENSNSELKWAGILWREVARRTGAAICIVHHTKKYATGMAGDVDAARGAGALIGIARIVSTLFPMTSLEADSMLEEKDRDQHILYLRYDDAKANLNLKSQVAKWFKKITVTLDNKTEALPGDDVGVLVDWKPKQASLLEDHILKFFQAVDRGICDDDGIALGEFYSTEKRAAHPLVPFAASFFEISETAAKAICDAWRKGQRLASIQHWSPKARKRRQRIVSELSPEHPRNRKKPDEPQPDQTVIQFPRALE